MTEQHAFLLAFIAITVTLSGIIVIVIYEAGKWLIKKLRRGK